MTSILELERDLRIFKKTGFKGEDFKQWLKEELKYLSKAQAKEQEKTKNKVKYIEALQKYERVRYVDPSYHRKIH